MGSRHGERGSGGEGREGEGGKREVEEREVTCRFPSRRKAGTGMVCVGWEGGYGTGGGGIWARGKGSRRVVGDESGKDGRKGPPKSITSGI